MRSKSIISVLMLVFALTFIVACNKDDDKPMKKMEKATISAKWIVSNSSDYDSFEFNESGNYIVVKTTTKKSTNGRIILFGTYEIIDNKTIVLSDFGTLTISKIDENSMSFSIKLTSNPNNEITIDASKQSEMESTTKTDLFCRTWELKSINGEDVKGTENELTVLFSAAGTYLVSWSSGASGLAQWKWKDESETKFLYSWEAVPNWENMKFVEIIELTNSTLKIFEKFKNRVDELYVFEPIVNTKSVMINSSVDITKQISKTGLLKK